MKKYRQEVLNNINNEELANKIISKLSEKDKVRFERELKNKDYSKIVKEIYYEQIYYLEQEYRNQRSFDSSLNVDVTKKNSDVVVHSSLDIPEPEQGSLDEEDDEEASDEEEQIEIEESPPPGDIQVEEDSISLSEEVQEEQEAVVLNEKKEEETLVVVPSSLEIEEEKNTQEQEDIKIKRRTKTHRIIMRILTILLLIFWAFVVIFPFYYMVMTSLKTYGQFASEFSPSLITKTPTLDNYLTSFTSINLLRYMGNTLIFALATTFLMFVVSTLAAFGFARISFKGKNFVFVLFLALMMIPTELVIITNFTTIVNLGWRNTFIGLVLPSITSVYYIYLLKENFQQVGDSVYYAAKIDGCSDFKYLTRVLIPINRPTIISVIILKLIECWNSYIWPSLITTDENMYLVSNGIQILRSSGAGRENIPLMMASVVIVSLPLIVLYLIFRRQIMAGVLRQGTKG